MLRIKTKVEVWKTLSEAIGALSELFKLNFDEQGMECSLMDPSHTQFLQLKMPATAFELYEIDTPVKLCLELSDLKAAVNLDDGEGTVTVEHDVNLDVSCIKFYSEFGERSVRLQREDHIHEPRFPDILFDTTTKLETSKFVKAVKALDADGSIFTIDLNDEGMLLEVVSGQTNTKFNIEGVTEGGAKSTFSLDLFKQIVKAFGDHATIKMSSDFPIRIDTKKQGCEMAFLVAPRTDVV